MAEASIPQIGCSDSCPLVGPANEAVQAELLEIDVAYKAAKKEEALLNAETQDIDLGDLSSAEFEKKYSTRMLMFRVEEFGKFAKDCDGVHCKLAMLLIKNAVEPPNPPSSIKSV